MSAPAKAPPTETVDQTVARLLAQWEEETAVLSDSGKIQSHPAYLAIIALGPPALPALFRYLEKTRNGHVTPALTKITGVQQVPPELRGRIREIADVWIKWGRENGYRQ